MAVRPYWKGYLKLSLVTCPVQMTSDFGKREGSLSYPQPRDPEPRRQPLCGFHHRQGGERRRRGQRLPAWRERLCHAGRRGALKRRARQHQDHRYLHLYTARQHRVDLGRYTLLFVAERFGWSGGLLGHSRRDGIPGHGRDLPAGHHAPRARRHAGATRQRYRALDIALWG